KAFRAYYLFESNECRYTFENKNDRFKEAKEYAKKAQIQIEDAVGIIEQSFDKLSDDTQRHLSKMKMNWGLCQRTIKLKISEPSAKQAMKEKDYISAMDHYKVMSTVQDTVLDYVNKTDLEEVFKRINRASCIAGKANIAIAKAGVLIKQQEANPQIDNTVEILELFIKSIELSAQAHDENPEWELYKTGKDKMYANIRAILSEYPNEWRRYYNHLENNKTLRIIMKDMDSEKFKQISDTAVAEKVNDDKTKKLLIYGCFWFFVFISLGALSTLLFLKAGWIIAISVLFATQIGYVMISSTVLRNLGDLSEKNMLDLYKTALRLNFNLLKKNKPEGNK
ncbi:MAG: hypothetical protein ACOZCO_17105, partial [Bacteroidota bacterium]